MPLNPFLTCQADATGIPLVYVCAAGTSAQGFVDTNLADQACSLQPLTEQRKREREREREREGEQKHKAKADRFWASSCVDPVVPRGPMQCAEISLFPSYGSSTDAVHSKGPRPLQL